MHFLASSLAPLAAPKDVGRAAAPRTLDQVRWGQGGWWCRVLNDKGRG